MAIYLNIHVNIRNLFEARRNPEQNSALRAKDVTEAVEPFFFRPDAYLTMTDIRKVGVNPNTAYDNTPSGIYAYPLGEQAVVSDFLHDRLPHAGGARYATVLKRSPSTTMLTDSMNAAELERPRAILDDKMTALVGDLWEKAKHIHPREIKHDAHKLFAETEVAANIMALLKKYTAVQLKSNIGFFENYMLSKNASRPRMWNGILREMGFDAVEDCGTSMIHPAEAFQTCFLSTRAIDNFEVFRNGRTYLHGKNEIQSAGHFFRLVERGKYEPLSALLTMDAILRQADSPSHGYNPDIRFSDTQIRTFVHWVADQSGETFGPYVQKETAKPWGVIRDPRLISILQAEAERR